jgi:hypothetical protein
MISIAMVKNASANLRSPTMTMAMATRMITPTAILVSQ